MHPPHHLAEDDARENSSTANEAMKSMLEKAVNDGKELAERVRQLEGQVESYKTRCEVITSELDFTKSEVRRLQESNTGSAVALALLQKTLDQERDIAESAREEAVKEAAARVVVSDMNGQRLSDLKVKCDELNCRLNTKRMVEEEICKLLDIDVADFATPDTRCGDDGHDSSMITDDGAKNDLLNTIKRRLDEYQRYAIMKEEAETKLGSCVVELQKIKADYQVSVCCRCCFAEVTIVPNF